MEPLGEGWLVLPQLGLYCPPLRSTGPGQPRTWLLGQLQWQHVSSLLAPQWPHIVRQEEGEMHWIANTPCSSSIREAAIVS